MNEYIIFNKTLLTDKLQELKKEREVHEKARIGMFDAIYVAKTSQAIDLLEDILSQSTPLIPEIEKAFGLGAANHAIGQPLLADYITNLKLDI